MSHCINVYSFVTRAKSGVPYGHAQTVPPRFARRAPKILAAQNKMAAPETPFCSAIFIAPQRCHEEGRVVPPLNAFGPGAPFGRMWGSL